MVQAPSRRDRVRAATIQEIKQTARRILVAEGPEAVSLRAIAREMGMTAPALYRYFGSHEDLIFHVVADIFTEIAREVSSAITAAADSGADMAGKLVAACSQFRRWALAHRPEFSLVFGSPLPALETLHDDVRGTCAMEFAGTFFALFAELWAKQPFPVPSDEELSPRLREQLGEFRAGLGAGNVPLGAMLTFLRCWVRLYGMVTLEVFGHLHFALDDPAPMFEYTLAELAELVGLHYPVGGHPGR